MSASLTTSSPQHTLPAVDLVCVLAVIHDVAALLCGIHKECQRLTNAQLPLDRRDPTLALVMSHEAIGRFKALWDVVHATTEPDLPGHTPIIDLAVTVETAVEQVRQLVEVYARAMEPRHAPVISFRAMRPALPVRAFPQIIQRVIQNLVINSFQAGAGTIWITLTIVLGEAVLVVHDDGPGFPPQVLEQVRPGYTTKLDGHGLGLVSVIANVQRLGGTVELENVSGAMVTVKVPLVKE